MSKDEIESEKFWQHQNKLWLEDRVSGGGGHMSTSGFVAATKKNAWIPETDVLPPVLAQKNPHFNPNGVCMPKGVDINSSLGRAILERQQNMAFENKPQNGGAWANKQKESPDDNRPNMKGHIYFSRDFIAELLEQPGELVKIDISLWTKEAASGRWQSINAQKPYKLDEQSAAAPAPAPKEQDSDVPF